MQKIAIFGRNIKESSLPGIKKFFKSIVLFPFEIYVYKPFAESLINNKIALSSQYHTFTNHNQLSNDFKVFYSLGGDGTFLESVQYVRDKEIPIAGINAGRLGFLANISQDEICESFKNILEENYSIERRSLLKFHCEDNPFCEFSYAFNEVTVQKHDSSLITIDTYIDGILLNKYWADGLIISTPSGSTAYSLSTGGPIVEPECRNIIISPIASHNLTVRPIVIPDYKKIELKITSRSDKFLVTIDSRSFVFGIQKKIKIELADFNIKIIKLPNHTYYDTIRKKLMWGVDIRN